MNNRRASKDACGAMETWEQVERDKGMAKRV